MRFLLSLAIAFSAFHPAHAIGPGERQAPIVDAQRAARGAWVLGEVERSAPELSDFSKAVIVVRAGLSNGLDPAAYDVLVVASEHTVVFDPKPGLPGSREPISISYVGTPSEMRARSSDEDALVRSVMPMIKEPDRQKRVAEILAAFDGTWAKTSSSGEAALVAEPQAVAEAPEPLLDAPIGARLLPPTAELSPSPTKQIRLALQNRDQGTAVAALGRFQRLRSAPDEELLRETLLNSRIPLSWFGWTENTSAHPQGESLEGWTLAKLSGSSWRRGANSLRKFLDRWTGHSNVPDEMKRGAAYWERLLGNAGSGSPIFKGLLPGGAIARVDPHFAAQNEASARRFLSELRSVGPMRKHAALTVEASRQAFRRLFLVAFPLLIGWGLSALFLSFGAEIAAMLKILGFFGSIFMFHWVARFQPVGSIMPQAIVRTALDLGWLPQASPAETVDSSGYQVLLGFLDREPEYRGIPDEAKEELVRTYIASGGSRVDFDKYLGWLMRRAQDRSGRWDPDRVLALHRQLRLDPARFRAEVDLANGRRPQTVAAPPQPEPSNAAAPDGEPASFDESLAAAMRSDNPKQAVDGFLRKFRSRTHLNETEHLDATFQLLASDDPALFHQAVRTLAFSDSTKVHAYLQEHPEARKAWERVESDPDVWSATLVAGERNLRR